MSMKIVIVGECRSEIAAQLAELAGVFGAEVLTLASETVARDTPGGGCSPIADFATSLRQPLTLTPDPDPGPGQLVPDPLELDADGQPWNVEIHSAKRKKKVDGRWTTKRGVDPARVAEVYAAYKTAAAVTPLSVIGDAATVAAAATSTAAGPLQPLAIVTDPLAPAPDPLAPPGGMPPGGALGATPFDGLGPASAPPADPIAECVRVATAMIAASEDPAVQAQISGRINQVMGTEGLQGLAELEANPDKAPSVLQGLHTLAVEIGVQC